VPGIKYNRELKAKAEADAERESASDLVFCLGAGDENRTRTISLGISERFTVTCCAAGESSQGLSASARQLPR
jgi:hypothetical protein